MKLTELLVLLAVFCAGHGCSAAVLDGVYTLTVPSLKATATMVAVSVPGFGTSVLNINNNLLRAPENDYGLAVTRYDEPHLIDVYTTKGNFTVIMDADGNDANITLFNNYTALFATFKLKSPPAPQQPAGALSFAGAWDSATFKATCLRSVNNWNAYFCVRNKLLPNGTVVSDRVSLIQNTKAPYWTTADAMATGIPQTYTLSKDGKTLTITQAGKPVDVMTRLPPPKGAQASQPPLDGLFRSEPPGQLMVCGTPLEAPSSALCVGAGMSPQGFPYQFTVVERRKPNNPSLTDQFTSLGAFSSQFAQFDAFKRQFFLGQAPKGTLLTVGYRVRGDVRTLRTSRVAGGVPVTCSGADEESVTCVGAGLVANATASFSMAARGLGLGQYDVHMLYTKGTGTAVYSGPLFVSPDGINVAIDYTLVVYSDLPDDSFVF